MKLLDGSHPFGSAGGGVIQSGANSGEVMKISIEAMGTSDGAMKVNVSAFGGDIERSIQDLRMDASQMDAEKTAVNNNAAEADNNLGILNRSSASVAVAVISSVLNNVSSARAELGAFQNRLEYKIANLDNSAENMSAAESRIRDADMAQMMTEFTRNNVLFQASTAMLAQANSQPQSVLQLLG